MPYRTHARTDVLRASGDLRTAQFRAIREDANGEAVIAGVGDEPIGVVEQVEGLGRRGDIVTYFVNGDHEVRTGGVYLRGARLVPDATGRLIQVTGAAGTEVRTYYRALEASDAADVTATVRREVADVRF